jgi:hypothetical protein
MRITEFIGDEIIKLIKPENNWITRPILDAKLCNEYEFDSSFFDYKKRVETKYKEIDGFNIFYNMSLLELDAIVNPPISGSRRVILGTTEYLLPYVAYCLKFIIENDVDVESGNRINLPFIFFAPSEWKEDENINFIDCLSYYYKKKKYAIHLLISKNKKTWLTRDGSPRVTICELMRLRKNLGNISIKIIDYNYDNAAYNVIIENDSSRSRKTATRRLKKNKSIRLMRSVMRKIKNNKKN